jgi:hypothetical protein
MFLLIACKTEEAKMVEEEISLIGSVTEKSYNLIQESRVAYDNLSEQDKGDIANYFVLEDAEIAYNIIVTGRVDKLIVDIGSINDESMVAIDLARFEYDKLTKDQKSISSNFGDLIVAEKEYENYIVKRSIETLKALSDISPEDSKAIELAEKIYDKLIDEQKILVVNEVGEVGEIIRNTRIKRVDKLIEYITYIKGEPSIDDLTSIIDALIVYTELSEDAQTQVTNYEVVEKALKGYSRYKKKRAKTDKVFIRETYINQCKTISYNDLMIYPKSYKGQQISMRIQILEIVEGVLILPDSIAAIVNGTEKVLELKDNRAVKEPVISEDDIFMIYGTFEGTANVTDKEEGSGLFGSSFLEKVTDKYEIPVIQFVYTSIDNIGVIATGDPNATDVGIDKENEKLKNQLDQIIEQIE